MTRNEIRKKLHYLRTTQAALAGVVLVSGTLLFSGIASAATASAAKTNDSSTNTASQQQRLQNIISKGNQEIERRLVTLDTLTAKINGASHLNSGDQSTLSDQVSSTVSGLTSLKAQLDGATTISAAHTDAEDIYTEYRVYALVAPKVGLIKVADDQQVVQSKLTALAAKLQTRITAEQQTGKNVQILQAELNNMNSQIAAAGKISSGLEVSTISLQPSDYNSDHSLLSGDNTQLKTAHTDDQSAYAYAQDIVSSLKTM